MSKAKQPNGTPNVPAVQDSKTVYPLEVYQRDLPEGIAFCTLPCKTISEVARVFRTIEMAQERLWDMRGTTFEVANIVSAVDEQENAETGEVQQIRRLILINPAGFAVQTPSAAARRSLYRQLERLAKPPFNRLPPYNPPVKVQILEQKSTDRNKGPWLHLVVNDDYGPDEQKAS